MQNKIKNNTSHAYETDKQKYRLPDQLELIMEDGTVIHVRSFFAEDSRMGDVLDALTMEKIDRAV